MAVPEKWVCVQCRIAELTIPHLREAIATTAMSYGISAEEMVKRFFAEYHRLGHKIDQFATEEGWNERPQTG